MNAISPAATKALQTIPTLAADEDGFASVKGQGLNSAALTWLCNNDFAERKFTAFSTARYQLTDKGRAALAAM